MPAELTQAIPVIATDAPAARHRRPCIVPALHERADLDVPPVARAVGAEAYRREVDARAALYGEGAAQSVAIDADRDREDPAVVAVAEMLTGSPEERRHRAREILTVVRLLESRAALAREVAALPRLRLRGVMALPAPSADANEQNRQLAAVRVVYEHLCSQGLPLDTLSMGMSSDLEAAVAQGSTMVRVGTALFGQR